VESFIQINTAHSNDSLSCSGNFFVRSAALGPVPKTQPTTTLPDHQEMVASAGQDRRNQNSMNTNCSTGWRYGKNRDARRFSVGKAPSGRQHQP